MPTIHSSSRQFLLRLGVSNLPKSADQIYKLRRDEENFFQLPAPTINDSLDNDIVGDDVLGLDRAAIANKDRPGQGRITINTDQNDTEYSERKETSPTSVDNFPIEKNSNDALGAAADDTTQGAYDVPIAERLKLRREKRAAAKKDDTQADGEEVNTLNMSLRKRKSLVLPGSEFNSSRKKRVPSGGIAKKKDAPVNMSMTKSSRSLRKRKSSVLDSDKDSSIYTTSALAGIEKPGPNDVMTGRGGHTNHHPGNIKFRRIIEDLKPTYLASTRSNKTVIAMKIVTDWRALNPPGRFLRMNEQTGLWDDIGDKTARGKCSQALREKHTNRLWLNLSEDDSGSTEESDDEEEEEETLHSKPELVAADLVVLPSHLRKKKASGHPLCKIKGCDKQGRSEKDEMCKAHYNTFKMAGRNTKETGEEVKSQLKSDCTVTERRSNRKKIAPELFVARPSALGVGEDDEEEALYPDVAELKIQPIQEGQGSTTDDMCKGHFTLFKKAGRSTKESDEEAGADNKDSSTYLGGKVATAEEEEEDEALYSDVAELKIVPKEDRLNNANGIPFCKVEGCPKQGRNESEQMCRSHFNMFQKAGRSTKETGEKIVVEELPQVKRGRGRPRKAIEIDTDTKQEKVTVVNEPSLVKRGRGRPKKNPIAEGSMKRGRGRPRKSSASQHTTEVGGNPDSSAMLTSLFSLTSKSSETSDAQLVEEDIRGQPVQAQGKPEVAGLPEKCNVEKRTMTLRTNRAKSSKLRENVIGVVNRPAPFEKRGRGRPRRPCTSSQLSREATMQQTAEEKTMTLRKHRVKSSKLRTSEIGAVEEDIGGEQKDQSEGKPTYNNSDIPIGVREMRSGNFEVSLSYHGQPRSIGTYTTLDDAVQANKVARSMLITERGVHLSVEQISTNIQSAKDAIKASGIAASNLSGQQSSNDIDFSSIGVYQTVAGSWTVIVCYQGKKRSMGTYRTKAEAALANKVARNFIAATKNSVLSIEESAEIAKLAKEAASKAVSEMMGNSEKHTAQAGKDTVGIRQIQSGNWSVKISFLYNGKQPTIGTFPTLEQATLANKVAREMLQSTKDSALTEVQIEQNVKLAKEAASKAVSEMYPSRGSRDDDEPNQEPGTLSPGRWQSNEVFIEWLTDRKSKWKQDRQNKHPNEDDRGPSLVASRWQTDKVFDEWLRDRKSKWKLQRPNRSTTGNKTSESNTSKQPTSYSSDLKDRAGPRAAGVYMTTSGNWEVRVRHQGSHITIGQSVLVQEIERGELDATKFSSLLVATKFFSLSFEQRQLAKEAAVVVIVNELATVGKQVPASNTLQTLKKQNRMEVSDKIADINSVYWSKFIEEKKKEALLQNKIQLEMKRHVPEVTNEGGTSVFENLWEKRTSANSNNEELEYEFFNGESNDQVVGLNSVRAVSLQNRKGEEEKELRLREADAVGGLLSLNLNGIVSSKVPGKGIKSPTAKDVLRGRGPKINKHEGNMKLRDEARKLRGDYQDGELGRSEKKYQYSLELVERVKSYGGRFLEKRGTTDNLWYEMSEEDTRKKAAQVLREKRWE